MDDEKVKPAEKIHLPYTKPEQEDLRSLDVHPQREEERASLKKESQTLDERNYQTRQIEQKTNFNVL